MDLFWWIYWFLLFYRFCWILQFSWVFWSEYSHPALAGTFHNSFQALPISSNFRVDEPISSFCRETKGNFSQSLNRVHDLRSWFFRKHLSHPYPKFSCWENRKKRCWPWSLWETRQSQVDQTYDEEYSFVEASYVSNEIEEFNWFSLTQRYFRVWNKNYLKQSLMAVLEVITLLLPGFF